MGATESFAGLSGGRPFPKPPLPIVARPRVRPPRPPRRHRNEKTGDGSPPFGPRGLSSEPNPVTLLGQTRV